MRYHTTNVRAKATHNEEFNLVLKGQVRLKWLCR